MLVAYMYTNYDKFHAIVVNQSNVVHADLSDDDEKDSLVLAASERVGPRLVRVKASRLLNGSAPVLNRLV